VQTSERGKNPQLQRPGDETKTCREDKGEESLNHQNRRRLAKKTAMGFGGPENHTEQDKETKRKREARNGGATIWGEVINKTRVRHSEGNLGEEGTEVRGSRKWKRGGNERIKDLT